MRYARRQNDEDHCVRRSWMKEEAFTSTQRRAIAILARFAQR